MSFKPIDAKRDEFRKYLERTGVLEAISKVFIKLIHCPDRPENAIDFICANLGSTLHQNDQIENLQKDLEESKDEIAELKQIIENLKTDKKLILVNEEAFQQPQESVKNALSDNGVNLQQQQVENIDTSLNCSEVNKNDSTVTKSTSNDGTQEEISPCNNEKNTLITDEPKIDSVTSDVVTETELTMKSVETVE